MPRQLELWDNTETEEASVLSCPDAEIKKQAGQLWNNDTERNLSEKIAGLAGIPVEVRITDNRSTLMKVVPASGNNPTQLSLHWMFIAPPPEILKGLARWVKFPNSKRDTSLFRAFMAQNMEKVRGSTVRTQRVRDRGRFIDLGRLYNEINSEEFSGTVNAVITWGKATRSRRRRGGHIRFGSYDCKANLIRIHPVLDSEDVPLFFVRYIVFHEMLHAFVGIGRAEGGRRSLHGPEFQRREQEYRDFEPAEAWLKHPGNLDRLLRARHHVATGL